MKRADATDLAGSTAVGSLVAFVLLTLIVTGQDGAALFGDQDLNTWSAGHRPPVALAVARGVTYTGTGILPYVLVALAGVVLGRTARQRVVFAVGCLGCLAAAQAVRYGVMSLVARPRPATAEWATHASGWSFPSGHTTTSAITGGLLVLAVLARAPRGGRPLAALIGCWAVLVGLTRVYLGVHWFSDVLGGWLFSLCWLSLSVYAVIRLAPHTYSSIQALRLRPGPTTTEERRDESQPHREVPPHSAP
ncbi:phosphatase PAP2 family protein [Streptomyces sp. NBC_01136]|uniref:phosphatase PAP2 family protein n=1 Tax=unclassified Streptomyces TaxID=2593676 RepID=UPI00324E7104|nr:phosphatase PAP2 family protein [Streptomyces sp. NBC_01136]